MADDYIEITVDSKGNTRRRIRRRKEKDMTQRASAAARSAVRKKKQIVRRSAAKPVKPMYYWAYGSNLNKAGMKVRCPAAVAVAPLYLEDGELVFRHVADVVGKQGSSVAGALWRITPACEARLDVYEGVSSGFYDKRYFPIEVDGDVHDCLFYKMRSGGIMPPSEGYLATIVQGYSDFDLDISLLEAALEYSWSKKRKTPDLRTRYLRKGRPSLARALQEAEEAETEERQDPKELDFQKEAAE